jgi:hypothetical protein
LHVFGDPAPIPSKLAPAVGASEGESGPLVFCAGVLERAAGPGGSGRAGCAWPGVCLGGIERSGGDLSWWTAGPESGEGGGPPAGACAPLAAAVEADVTTATDPADSNTTASSALKSRLDPVDGANPRIFNPPTLRYAQGHSGPRSTCV